MEQNRTIDQIWCLDAVERQVLMKTKIFDCKHAMQRVYTDLVYRLEAFKCLLVGQQKKMVEAQCTQKSRNDRPEREQFHGVEMF